MVGCLTVVKRTACAYKPIIGYGTQIHQALPEYLLHVGKDSICLSDPHSRGKFICRNYVNAVSDVITGLRYSLIVIPLGCHFNGVITYLMC